MNVSLNGSDWVLTGWNRHQWKFYKIRETGGLSRPMVAPIPAQVPGSVQTDLLRAGVIEDWNRGKNFLAAEWVEHREWVYEKVFTVTRAQQSVHSRLCFEGLDFAGHVFLNGERLFSFDQMHRPYEADVTGRLTAGENHLRVVLLQPPEVDGQVGYTSKTTVLKSRYNYGWDWMPRLVNIGIFGAVTLRFAESAVLKNVYPKAAVEPDGTGVLLLTADVEGLCDRTLSVRYTVSQDGGCVASGTVPVTVKAGKTVPLVQTVRIENVRLWYPAGMGQQPLYTVELQLLDNDTVPGDCFSGQVGFCTITYSQPEGAAEFHLPYAVTVNGEWMPIKGMNWVPISPFYGSVTEEDYRYYLGQLLPCGINLLRIWGGALLESEMFYRLCDEQGILVWQEFPQSSSGIDNAPCEEPAFVQTLCEMAEWYLRRRRHHVCLAFWCGGNELYDAVYRPVAKESGNITALAKTVQEWDPDRLFLPTSPSGPVASWSRGMTSPEQCGDTHGPWLYEGPREQCYRFNHDRSLLHSEVGAPACPRLESLKKYADHPIWPFDERDSYWLNRGAWWIYNEELIGLFGEFEPDDNGLSDYVRAYRYTQMEAIRYAATSIRRAGKRKAGLIVWMANEPFPNSANTSLLEYDGCPKPAYYKLKNAFAPVSLGLGYETPAMRSHGGRQVEVYAFSDRETVLHDVTVEVFDCRGSSLKRVEYGTVRVSYTETIGELTLPGVPPLILVRLTAAGEQPVCEEYVFTINGRTPFGALLALDCAPMAVTRASDCRFLVKNTGKTVALYVDAVGKDAAGRPLVMEGSGRCLLPGEGVEIFSVQPCAELTVETLNRTREQAEEEAVRALRSVGAGK